MAVLTAVAAPAQWDRRLAVGYNPALDAASLRWFVSPTFGLEASASGGSQLSTPLDTLFVDAQVGLGVRAITPVQERRNTRLLAFASATAAIDDITEDPDLAASLVLSLAFGISPEILLTDHLSVSTDLGLEITAIDILQPVYKLRITTAGSAVSSVGGISFHWYLR